MNCCVAILVMKMEEKATCLAYYALFKKGKNAAETHTELSMQCVKKVWWLSWLFKVVCEVSCWLFLAGRYCTAMCTSWRWWPSSGDVESSHVCHRGAAAVSVCRREAAAVTCAAGRPLQSRVPQGGRCSHVCRRGAAAVTCAAGGPLPHSECPDQALRSICASSVMSITVMFEFLISKEKNLLDHLSTCNSPVKGNKNVLFLKQIVLGDEK